MRVMVYKQVEGLSMVLLVPAARTHMSNILLKGVAAGRVREAVVDPISAIHGREFPQSYPAP